MTLQPVDLSPRPAFTAATAHEVTLHHLRTPAEIESVLHLREGIDLSVHADAGGSFIALEKKEMRSGLSALLSSKGK